jgi:phosphoribosylaminoimidazolecarboxamide formyltransferase/IMP cyclohydrolase
LVDVDHAAQLMDGGYHSKPFRMGRFSPSSKHTNPCGIASRPTVKEALNAALAGDPESAFGCTVCNEAIDKGNG